MRIYTMTATFGKLEHETLVLKPGLNIIEAPNEWGKSTWCAFLVAMLYGLDTRAKTTKTALADKERFAPWSGAPMAGRIDLNWQGKDITIERQTKRRVPLGEFRAYETETGLPVPEFTAANCGQMLLGVEQTVFRRAGFIRHSDLPVTQDEALRRRLNALVTTGDESGSADRLAQQLRDLKNRCRYNRTGLLPQAEAQRDAIDSKLQELENLNLQSRKLQMRLEELKQTRKALENHQKMLNYTASQLDARRVAQARDARDQGLANLTRLEHATADLPPLETARREVEQLTDHIAKWNDLLLEEQMLPPMPPQPEEALPFRGLTGTEAITMAEADQNKYKSLLSIRSLLPWILGMVFSLIAAVAVLLLTRPLWLLVPGLAAILCLVMLCVQRKENARKRRQLEERYGSPDPQKWTTMAWEHAEAKAEFSKALAAYRTVCAEFSMRKEEMAAQRQALGRGETPEKALYLWNQAIHCWEEYHSALRDQTKLENHLQDLQSMARSVEAPEFEDTMTYTEGQTLTLINDAASEQQRLQTRLGQYRGQMEALGDPTELQKQHAALCARIERLEDQYTALTIAQETLTEARQELQRRFAPRISRRAQELLGAMTQGRYNRLTLGSDFSLQAGTVAEDILHDAWWRSDGTMDQLYLALRLAVAEELTPEAPVILDDALVRFDDKRAKAALEILDQEAGQKQILLFTCHSRENQLLSKTT